MVISSSSFFSVSDHYVYSASVWYVVIYEYFQTVFWHVPVGIMFNNCAFLVWLCFSLQDGCSKVYISTSDVQMHGNYHRKDSAIIQEGFQRFRATENCCTPSCLFADQKTTHFHCRRSGCSFTFKNKSDMGMCIVHMTSRCQYTPDDWQLTSCHFPVTSRLRSCTPLPRPTSRTKKFQSFINFALNKYQSPI